MAAQKAQPQVAEIVPQVAYASPAPAGTLVGTMINGVFRVIGFAVGMVAGGFVWALLSRNIPQGVTVIEKIGRYALLSGASIVTQRAVSEAIISDYEDTMSLSAGALDSIRAQRSLPAAVEQQVQQA